MRNAQCGWACEIARDALRALRIADVSFTAAKPWAPAVPPLAAVVWTVPSGNLKPPDADWMVPEQVRLPGTIPPEMSQPVVRSGEVRKRRPPAARTTNELSAVAWTSAPDTDVERSP